MKYILILIAALFLLCEVRATSIAVPSFGKAVRDADTIAKGSLSVDGTNVVFLVNSSVKGKYHPLQSVMVSGNSTDIFFNLAHYALQLQGQPCFILGVDRGDDLYLPWNDFSVWPQGVAQKWPALGDIDTCAAFIDKIVEYEQLESAPNTLLAHLLNALQVDTSRPAVLAYLNSSPSLFQNDKSLERDVLSVVAAYISSHRIYDEWTASCMRSLSPSMPQSITIPYFMEVVKKGGREGELAQSIVRAALKSRRLIDRDVHDRESLSAVVATVLPNLRVADAQNNAHLFDAASSDIRALAGLVFSEIYDEPRPSGKNTTEEKAFWMNKTTNRQK